jgi:hypothetical protein
MKNAVFWDIKIQILPHRKHIVSATECEERMNKYAGLVSSTTKQTPLLWTNWFTY